MGIGRFEGRSVKKQIIKELLKGCAGGNALQSPERGLEKMVQNISSLVKQYPESEIILEATRAAYHATCKMMGPTGRAFAAGGSISDLIGRALGTREAPISDIDVFATVNDDMFSAFEAEGFQFNEKKHKYWDDCCCQAKFRKHSIPVHVVWDSDPSARILTFDLMDRLAWCDGLDFWATDEAIKSIKDKELRLNRLNTPQRTAIRMHKFSERHGMSIEPRSSYALKLLLGSSSEEFRNAIKRCCKSDCSSYQVAKLFCGIE